MKARDTSEIIDPHVHLWDIRAMPGLPQEPQAFLVPDLAAAIAGSGHAVTHTVFVECHQMYRAEGPAAFRSIGETEFANGMAAMSASGGYGPARLADRIVASIDLRGDAVPALLDRHRSAAGGRLRGIRMNTAFRESGLFGAPCDADLRGRLRDPRLHAGARVLAEFGLSLDVWCVQSQLADVAVLADAVPELTVVLDHCGTPETRDGGSGEGFADWAARIRDLARRPNVYVKLGGLGMDIDCPIANVTGDATGAALAAAWRPYLETCIAAFSPERAMFESNYPPDRAAGSYAAIWDAFRQVTRGYSEAEADRLFRTTAAATYGIDLAAPPLPVG